MKGVPDAKTSPETEVSPPPNSRFVPKPKGAWLDAVGTLKECELSEAAFRQGAEWREQMNREGK